MNKWYTTGTISVSNGSKNVTGVGTLFVTAVNPGDIFTVDGSKIYQVDSVTDNTNLLLTVGYGEASVVNGLFAIIQNFTGTMQADIAAKLSALILQYHVTLDQMSLFLSSSDPTITITDYNGNQYIVNTIKQISNLIGVASGGINLGSSLPTGMRTINSVSTTTYTLSLTDAAHGAIEPILIFTSTPAVTVTVPLNAAVAFPVGAQIDVIQDGVGKVTFSPATGVTINSSSGSKSISAQYAAVTLIQKAIDIWYLFGGLTA
jgi:hypothetical protein